MKRRSQPSQERKKEKREPREKERKKERKKERRKTYLVFHEFTEKPYQTHVSSRFACANLKEDERGREQEEETRETSKKTELVS